ncbi:hypothetical protein C9994_07775 [Marivirga lumbricoides]|uniref:TnsE C-terminal domain-containing protein n=1 Tax=Marivirga lumbricoides TaxID=1046115 RepID=A0A2T4DRA9_9BACT|nr:hypothetical protein C9994_07775 [Marivirga lumbricoides]
MKSKIFFAPPELNKKYTYWISGIGQVRFKEKSIFIKIVLYKLSELVKPSEFEFDMNQLASWKPIVLWIDIGMMPDISIGCFIHKTKLLPPKKNLKKLRITNLGLEEEKGVSYSKLKSIYDFRIDVTKKELDDKIVKIPSYGFPFSKLKDLPCLYYAHHEEHKLYVIPSIEVIRFYFFTSTEIANLLCGYYIKEHMLANPKLSSTYRNAKYDGTDFIQLSKHVPNEDVLTVARIYLYENALRAANMIRNSIVSSTIDEEGGFPRSFFPFNDSSNIDVNTIEMGTITIDGPYKGYSAELISRIESCDYKFLQNGFEWHRDNDNSKADQTDADKRKGSRQGDPPKDTNELNIRGSQQPHNPSKRKKKLKLNSSRFSGAPDKDKLRYRFKTEQKTVTEGRVVKQEDSDEETFSQDTSGEAPTGSGSIGNKPPFNIETDKQRKNREDRESYIRFFNNLSKRFQEDSQFKINTYSLFFNETKWSNQFITRKMERFSTGKKIRDYDYLPVIRYKWEGRREVKFIRIQVKTSGSLFYLFDVIQREGTADPPTLLFLVNKPDYSDITENEFQEIFLLFAQKRKMELPNDKLRMFERDTSRRIFILREVDKDQKGKGMKTTYKEAEQSYLAIKQKINNKI